MAGAQFQNAGGLGEMVVKDRVWAVLVEGLVYGVMLPSVHWLEGQQVLSKEARLILVRPGSGMTLVFWGSLTACVPRSLARWGGVVDLNQSHGNVRGSEI